MGNQGPSFVPGDPPAEGQQVEITWLRRDQQPGGASPTPPGGPKPGRHRWIGVLVAGVGVLVLALLGAYALVDGQQEPAAGSHPAAAQKADDPNPAAPAEAAPPPTGQPDFSAVIADAGSSVVRVVASTCRGTGVGSGFLISPDTVVASLSSVDQAVAVAIVGHESRPVPGDVVGVDPSSGVALIQLDRSVSAQPLRTKPVALAKGQWVAPVGLSSRSTQAAGSPQQVTADAVTFDHHETTLSGLARLPGPFDPSLLGAPVMNTKGAVVGAIFGVPQNDERLVVSGAQLSSGIDEARLHAPDPARCDRPTGPHRETAVAGQQDAAVTKALSRYFAGINAGDYDQAFAQLGPAFHRDSTVDDYIGGWVSSYDFNVTIRSTSGSGSSTTAWVTFDSIFADGRGPEGASTCARWSIDYTFATKGGDLFINGSDKHGADSAVYLPC